MLQIALYAVAIPLAVSYLANIGIRLSAKYYWGELVMEGDSGVKLASWYLKMIISLTITYLIFLVPYFIIKKPWIRKLLLLIFLTAPVLLFHFTSEYGLSITLSFALFNATFYILFLLLHMLRSDSKFWLLPASRRNAIFILFVLLALFAAGTWHQMVGKPANEREQMELRYQKGDTIRSRIFHIVDGDSYSVTTPDGEKLRVRMEGIDAPEKSMPYFEESRDYLNKLTEGEELIIIVHGVDRYSRILAYTYLRDGRELSHEMLLAGYAWHYKQYNKKKALRTMEKIARTTKRGLWKDKNPQPPWEFREQQREENHIKQEGKRKKAKRRSYDK